MRSSLLLLILAAGCDPATTTPGGKETGSDFDVDGDGFVGEEDCDEEDGTVHLGAAELCDGLDNDCDGMVDDEATNGVIFYADGDSDGFGDPAVNVSACAAPAGFVDIAGDCNDADSTYNPSAVEDSCTDPNDYNCDGSVGFADADADGTPACEDCNDADGNVNPGATELCNGVDDDCSGTVDDGAADAITFYEDTDQDGYGTDITTLACEQPEMYARYDGDCDDDSAAWHPNASETDCSDPNDYNCDGSVGYADGDGDGWAACEECDDAEATHFPGADEYCDGQDDNCDGTIDEAAALDATTWYSDADGDTYGDAATPLVACDRPAAYVLDTEDCDDSDASEFPGAVEICDGDDDDCDTEVDEASASDAAVWYADVDTDGYGDPASTVVSCTQPAGWLASAGDCDDSDDTEYPGADERCDGDDDNCDGEIDEDASIDAETWYADADGDGFGDAAATAVACALPSGFVADDTDCDDTSALVSPLGIESCNGLDDNCDGAIDEDAAIDAVTWYADTDADSYGDAGAGYVACEMPAGHSASGDDCDDTDATENPAADERCDGDDDNCDGLIDEDTSIDVAVWYVDFDSDGYGDAGISDLDCDQPVGYVADSTDCDDAAAGTYPAASERCDALDVDEDCSGAADDADATATGQTDWYVDSDGDTYGNVTLPVSLCDQPSGYVADASDCDDADSGDYPGAIETTGNGDDEDCDGGEQCWEDGDSDGYRPIGSVATVVSADDDCGDAGEGTDAEPESDCDDADGTENPAADERCDGDDDDCDGDVDEDGAVDVATWFADADADGFGDAATADIDCDQPSGYVSDSTDCDDADGAVNPDEAEVCDASDVDEDCSGAADDDDGGAMGQTDGYLDDDADGSGDADASLAACDLPSDYVFDDTDCDDADAGIHPGATEVCDAASVDEDCSGLADDEDSGAVGQVSFYMDADSDAFGDASVGVSVCDQPAGYVEDSSDCDDTLTTVYPGAAELCDAIDNDCDTEIDEGATSLWYADTDADGYGDSGVSTSACSAPADHVADGTDCDDDESSVYPGAPTVCGDLLINDCAGTDSGCELAGTGLVTAVDQAYWYGIAASDNVGVSGAGVGDISGDGADDILFGANQYDPTGLIANAGRAWLYEADTSAGGTELSQSATGFATFTASSTTNADYLGYQVSAAGYFASADAMAVVIGATNMKVGTFSVAGEAYVFDDPVGSLTKTSASLVVQGRAGSDNVGYDVSGGYDVNDDGLDDVVVGAYGYDTGSSTSVYDGLAGVFFGGRTGTVLITAADAAFTGTAAASDQAGQVLAMVPDISGDGIDDLAISAYKSNGASDYGTVYVVYGDASLTGAALTTAADATLDGPAVSAAQLGRSVDFAGDITGDGMGDLVVGADGDSNGTVASGAAYVFAGPVVSAATTSAAITLMGGASGDFFGRSVAGGGDFDGDGNDDLGVGATSADVPASGAGAAALWYGPLSAATYASSTADVTFTGMVASDALGASFDFVGDTNADGFDDLLLGVTSYDSSTASVGGIFLIRGQGN